MSDFNFDIQSARNLFSKAEKVSFGFLDKVENKQPSIYLLFRAEENKKAQAVFHHLSEALKGERFQLFINENGGDYLSLSFLWKSRGVLFTSSPDQYDSSETRLFRTHVFYGDAVKIFFLIMGAEVDQPVKDVIDNVPILNLDGVYYKYIP